MAQPKEGISDSTTALYTIADIHRNILRNDHSSQRTAETPSVPIAGAIKSYGSSDGCHIILEFRIEDCSVNLPLEIPVRTVPEIIGALTSGCQSALAMRKDTAGLRYAWSVRRWTVGIAPGRDLLMLSLFTATNVEFTFQIDSSTSTELVEAVCRALKKTARSDHG